MLDPHPVPDYLEGAATWRVECRFRDIAMNTVLPTTPRGAGTEGRAWIRAPYAASLFETRHPVVTTSVSVRMRDGARLSGILHRPAVLEPVPGILIANGYGKAMEPYLADTISRLAERGYIVLLARLRGLSPSEGEPGLYERFGVDTHDLIVWLGQQEGCNGRLGMFGASLLGLVQYLGAREAPPGLDVLLPDDAGSDNYWYLWHPGGAAPGPGRAARRSVSGAECEYSQAIAHADYDAFWRDRTVQAQDFEAIARRGVAVFLTSGWDSYLLGSTKSFEWLKAGHPGTRLKMFVGPWGHGAFMSPDSQLPGANVMPLSGFEYSLLWLDRWLRGIKNGVEEEPPVLIYVQGPNEWRFELDWPLPDERQTRLYLRGLASGTSSGLNDGSLSAECPRDDQSVTYLYSPSGPYNMAAVTGLSRPRIDKASYEAHGLSWTSARVKAPTEMTGYPKVSFWAALSATDTDFVIEITDVSELERPGRPQSLQVTRGYLNAMRFFSRSNPRPLVPHQPYRFELELYPTSYVFAAGHRIRLTLQGSAIDPLFKQELSKVSSLSPQDTEHLNIAHGPGLNGLRARVTVFQAADRPAYIDLPIIGAGPPIG